ncbi:major capsid protein [Roseovarius sp. D0-M9]|uniref:major capsid protein n=1 Tax=Roseovarius sp. D0-M9 TaxID=3127117 RepID=UPI00300FE1E8
MAVTRISDVVVPDEFTSYVIQNTMEASALVQAGVVARNGVIEDQLQAGADSFNVPFWNDLADDEADVVSDDPAVNSTPKKLSAEKQIVRKSFLHQSWSAMNLASELTGDNALPRIQGRAEAYWTRQTQRRLISSLNGVLADNVANDAGDMVVDISAETGAAALFSASAVIDAAGTLGDQMSGVTGIAMHSDVYRKALKDDMIETIRDSEGRNFQSFRGMAVVVDDLLPVAAGDYTSILFAPGAIGWGLTEPRIAEGTEIENLPSAGNGGGQQILHSRVNLSIHPAGFQWSEGSVAGDSPTITELGAAANWNRIVERKAVGLAFLIARVAEAA